MFVMIADSFWQCLYVVPPRDVKTSSIVTFDAKDTSGFLTFTVKHLRCSEKNGKQNDRKTPHEKDTRKWH